MKLLQATAYLAFGSAALGFARTVSVDEDVVELVSHSEDEGDLPNPGIELIAGRVALVVTDPQNDFLSPDGVTWGLVGKSVTENKTVEHIAALFAAAKANDVPVFVSPHYYYPQDDGWKFGGSLETAMHAIRMFHRESALSTEGFDGSGADWLEQYDRFIEDGATIVSSPHKVFGPDSNDLVLQLRKRGIDQVILAGMSANLCVESHLRELLEQGFEVAVVRDATAGARTAEGDGYTAALVNFRMLASAVVSTDETVAALEGKTSTDAAD